MREVLPPVLDVGFGDMGLDRIEATVDPDNARSIRLLEGIGFAAEVEPREGLQVFFREPGPFSGKGAS